MKLTLRVELGPWAKIHREIAQEYPPSVLLLRYKMKDVLGFTTRHHKQWVDINTGTQDYAWNQGYHDECIMLDFYSDKKMSWFLLKYSDIINAKT